MSTASPTVALDRVREAELDDIKLRREVSGLPADPERELVGVSLSGGGVRSACFGMGFVQALNARGVWRWVDYLSTVSGGGYIGAFLSSAVVRRQEKATRDNFPLQDGAGNRQPPSVLRFIYGGNYLLNAWELANKYFIGLLFINLAIFSALVALGAAAALVWRAFDSHWFRERADMLDLHVDLYAAFWPFVCFSVGWFVAWGLSYYRRGAEAPGKIARWLLYATVGSFVIGIALLMGNGDILLPTWAGGSLEVSRTWWGSIVGLLLGTLLPLVQPKRLIQSGIKPKHHWERWMFLVVTTAMLVGVPVAIVGTVGRENISGYSDAPNRPLVRQDIDDPHALSVLFGADPSKSVELRSWPAQALPAAVLNIHSNSFDKPINALATSAEHGVRAHRDATVRFKQSNEYCSNEFVHYVQRMYQTLGWWLGDKSNSAAIFWQTKLQQFLAQEQLCAAIEHDVLPSTVLLQHLVDSRESGASKGTATGAAASPSAGGKANSSTVIDGLLRQASLDMYELKPHEVKRLNRLLLEEQHPSIFRPRSEVRRSVCIWQDQQRRLWILGISLGVFVIAGAWVDLNATSMHGYYRNRLARAFVIPKTAKSGCVALSELNTTDYGAPYHLLSASVGWFHRQLSCDAPQEQRRAGETGEPLADAASSGAGRQLRPRREDNGWESASIDDQEVASWVDSFLFSRRYCGSQATGYLATGAYEAHIRGDLNRVDLAEAVALSGGALTPGQVHNPFIAFLMFALNLRLGQWLPNPTRGTPRGRPNVLQLLSSLRKKPNLRQYCFVSDGGHCENLGLLALLRRKCRLVIAVDAGQDPEHCFDDLARVLRDARIHDGIRVCPLSKETTDQWIEGIQAGDLVLNTGDDSGLAGQCKKHFLLARIHYPDGGQGLLVYVKPSLDGDEPLELLQYAARNKAFPHESTSDQLFDPAQVESYRSLGYHIGQRLLREVSQWKTVDELCQQLENGGPEKEVAPAALPAPAEVKAEVRSDPQVVIEPPSSAAGGVSFFPVAGMGSSNGAEVTTALIVTSESSPPERKGKKRRRRRRTENVQPPKPR